MAQRKSQVVTFGGVLAVSCLAATLAAAEDLVRLEQSESHFHADVEVDPFAYAFGGYSVHVGVGYRGLRFDLGAFALDMPGFLEPNEDFQSGRNGYGFKFQYYPFTEQSGAFFGAQVELAHELIESELSAAAHRERQLNLGVHLGWRFMLGDFYVTPWLLMNYALGAEDVQLDGNTYEATSLVPFATLHVGYRLL
jgi:hypothetical protein